MVRAADEPNLPAARRFTRELGPAALASGVLILFNGIVLIALESPYSSWLAAPYGLLLAAFGAAAYVRTETALGKVLRWMVVAIFSFGGCYALLQWAQLIWGSRAHALEGDLMLMGLYLMAGPALLVPAGLALARPGWVPLIVVPAIVALAGASVVGHGTLLVLEITGKAPMVHPFPDIMLVGGVALTSAMLILYSAYSGLTAARRLR